MSLLRKARRSTLKTILIWAFLMIPASAFLYSTNGQVRALEKQMQNTAQALDHEKESLRVLRAEWAYLNNPQRLANAAKTYLTQSHVVAAAQILPMDRLNTKLASRPQTTPVAAGTITIDRTGAKTAMLAKPISYDATILPVLHHTGKAALPSSAAWTQKLVSAYSTPANFTPVKAGITP